MKKILVIVAALTLLAAACKNKTAETEKSAEEQKADTMVKSDKEKGDSVLKHYQKMMEEKPDTLPEMK